VSISYLIFDGRLQAVSGSWLMMVGQLPPYRVSGRASSLGFYSTFFPGAPWNPKHITSRRLSFCQQKGPTPMPHSYRGLYMVISGLLPYHRRLPPPGLRSKGAEISKFSFRVHSEPAISRFEGCRDLHDDVSTDELSQSCLLAWKMFFVIILSTTYLHLYLTTGLIQAFKRHGGCSFFGRRLEELRK
jgi:hypothetical protein